MKEEKEDFLGKIEQREIVQEMKESYLDYAMSVIVARALPDIRDGLKPVHRRILYAMNNMGLGHRAKTTKSAKIIGEVLGKYHPHGDMAVYDAMVRLAQPWNMRYPLVQGLGNFGSIDGDSAAAPRYTEARLTSIAEEMLADIQKDTVDFTPNYDGTEKEPKVLPSKIPQLLLNGTSGIAVGMATNIPPHNLGEVVDGLIHLIDNPEADTADLMEFVKGPDFPTGGVIYNQKDILEAYSTGKGAILSRGIAEVVESTKGNRFQIIISQIPYQVVKSTLVEKIADLVKDKRIDGIKDLRDESDREGMRIVIELKSDAQPQKIINSLYKFTDLQKTFHLNLLGLSEGIVPQTLALKSVLEQFLKHRFNVVKRRTKFDLTKAQERAHILEGLLKALNHIDAIIKTIKSSANREAAKANLMKKFDLSDRQTEAILEMKLASLAALEQKKIEDELKEKLALIKELTALLKDERKIGDVIKKELVEMKDKYGDERMTKIVKGGISEFKEEDLVAAQEALVALSFSGFIKRMAPEVYRLQKRGGKGIIGAQVKEEDPIEHFLTVNTHDTVLFFSSEGRQFSARAFEIPEGSRISRGKALVNILNLGPQERITALLSLSNEQGKKEDNKFFLMATRNGKIKKTPVEDFRTNRKSGLLAIKLQKGDELVWVAPTSGSDEIVLTTKSGASIRFSEKTVRPMGRSASGVSAIRLKGKDAVIGMDVIKPKEAQNASLMVLTTNGYGKRTLLKEYRIQGRGGSGITAMKITEKTGSLAAAFVISDQEELVAISQKGQVVRVKLAEIPQLGRSTQGVRVMKLDEGDNLASAALL